MQKKNLTCLNIKEHSIFMLGHCLQSSRTDLSLHEQLNDWSVTILITFIKIMYNMAWLSHTLSTTGGGGG